MNGTRSPAVAGFFYPGDQHSLREQIESLLSETLGQPMTARGAICPHAGYRYSGRATAITLNHTRVTPTVLLLGPKHHRIGSNTAIFDAGAWRTPLGDVPINEDLSTCLKETVPELEPDDLAHSREHSLEVIVPFLQVINPDVRIVPIALGYRPYEACRSLGRGLGRALAQYDDDVLMIASSDLNHHEDEETTRAKDEIALEKVRAFDGRGLLDVCEAKSISMCGVIPTTVMLEAALELGAESVRQVCHTTSAEASGDYSQVVGYAGLLVS